MDRDSTNEVNVALKVDTGSQVNILPYYTLKNLEVNIKI